MHHYTYNGICYSKYTETGRQILIAIFEQNIALWGSAIAVGGMFTITAQMYA
ncbi:hypothetical protein ACVWZV_002194 [Bradyrhizobium sp. GM5.1]